MSKKSKLILPLALTSIIGSYQLSQIYPRALKYWQSDTPTISQDYNPLKIKIENNFDNPINTKNSKINLLEKLAEDPTNSALKRSNDCQDFDDKEPNLIVARNYSAKKEMGKRDLSGKAFVILYIKSHFPIFNK